MTFLPKKCEECNGSGWVRVASTWDEGDVVPDLCPDCDGSGWLRVASSWDEGDVVPDRCWECGGTGEYSDEQDAEEQRQSV